MRKSAWYVLLGAAVLAASAAGCGDDDGDVIVPADAGMGDAAMGDAGMGPDGSVMPACGASGTVGGLCRADQCGDDLECVQALGTTARMGFDAFQVEATDSTNSAFRPVETPVPANDVPVRFLAGEMCVQQCNTASTTNTCGSCARCSDDVGYDVLGLPPWWWFERVFENAQFGENTGVCRSTCDFDADSRGGCPEGYTCDAFTNICLEGCVSNAQCNAVFVLTEDGNFGTWVVPDGGRTCNAATGRCEWTNSKTETVGDVCERQADCTEDIGVCLRGGTCAETQCGAAPDTDMTTFECDGGRGLCIGTGGNNGSLCLQGCNTSDDCNPGNACIPIGETRGSFSGYCLGVCDTTMSNASDTIIACGHGEQCDMPEATAENPDPDGTCRPTCNPTDQTGCESGEFCEGVAGASHGFCRRLNDFCFEAGGDECFNGQICDNAIGTGIYGRCVDACTAAVPGDVCDGVDPGDVCTTAGTSCDGDNLVTCAPNAQGCLVETVTPCDDACDETGAAPAVCTTTDACPDPAPCTAGRTCVDGNLVICAPDQNGCLVETTATCDDGCDDSGTLAVCVTPDATPSSCADGDVCVTGSGPLAGLCATPCTTDTAATVCGTGRSCDVPPGMSSGFCIDA